MDSDSEEELMEQEETLHGSTAQLLLTLDRADALCPESYQMNSPDETRLLAIADNFQRQYTHLFPDRKPLLLYPVNECGVKKFVSLSLRPTPTVYPELFSWEGCAEFVANYLSMEPLEPPVDLPRYMFSSTSVLQSQRATCFEFSTLLCSLLLGANYDAYCVSGYAVRELCVLDQSLLQCPLLEDKSVSSEQQPQENQYTVKPPKQLRSRFLTQQEKKKQDAEAALLQKQKLQQESGKRQADPLRGLRVHCWVMVQSGSRSVTQDFFIEPLTGKRFSTTEQLFLGVESIWNNLNYYVNMQDCRNGCTDMVYDLEDVKKWEPVLYGATSKKQLILEVLQKKENKMMIKLNNDEEEDEEPRVFEMPRSWVGYLSISKKDLESRWPGRQKVTLYRKAKLERFEAYLKPDGLVTRLTTYRDIDCTEVAMVKEWYQHRNDHLEEKEVNKVQNFTSERFKRGRPRHLLFHRFTSPLSDSSREMEFSSARVDELERRVEAQDEMKEFYKDRKDFLYFRHVVFEQHAKPAKPNDDVDPDYRHPKKIVERFHRNRSKQAYEDVAERVFLLAERRMELTYHLDDHRCVPSQRSFIKPEESTEQKRGEEFTPDMVSGFQVEAQPPVEPPENLALHKMLMALMKDEEKVLLQIQESKKEVKEIVAHRKQDEREVQLIFSPWTTKGAAQARSKRQEMERLASEEQRWLEERETDILAPLLLRLDSETVSAEDAMLLYSDCLAQFRERLVEHANLIQERYEKETEELQQKQQWYQRNQLTISKAQEADYHGYCSEKTLRIHVTKRRLNMHKEAAPQKYQVLDQKLKRDPRLAPYLLS